MRWNQRRANVLGMGSICPAGSIPLLERFSQLIVAESKRPDPQFADSQCLISRGSACPEA